MRYTSDSISMQHGNSYGDLSQVESVVCGPWFVVRARCGYHIREGAVNTGSSHNKNNNKLQQVQKLICMHEIAKWAKTRPRHVEAPDSHFPVVICYENPSETKPTTNSWAQPRRQTSVSDLHIAIVCLAMRLVYCSRCSFDLWPDSRFSIELEVLDQHVSRNKHYWYKHSEP